MRPIIQNAVAAWKAVPPRPMERPNSRDLRCPMDASRMHRENGDGLFVRGLLPNDRERGGWSWLITCYDCSLTFAVSTTGRRA